MKSLKFSKTLPDSSAQDFFFEGSRADLLFVHGFSSSPYELLPLAQVLRQLDVRCRSVTLSGHCTKVEDLNKVTAQDWKNDIQKAFLKLDEHRPRFIIAASMGAALSVILSTNLPKENIDGLILLAPALIMHPKAQVGIRIATKGLGYFVKTIDKAHSGGDLADPEGRKRNMGYKKLPILALSEFQKIRKEAFKRAPKLKVPILVFQGVHDNTVAVAASEYLIDNSAAQMSALHLLPRSQHVIGLDYDRHIIERHSATFIEQRIGQYHANAKRREL